MLDLTPFGFTPTQGSAYERLLSLGPSSGYAVAKSLAIARTNAYQALDGLIAKGAATLVGEDPKTYRAVSPGTLHALISQRQARQLDNLDASLDQLGQDGSASLREFSGSREFGHLILRAATRAKDRVLFLGPGSAAVAAAPIWRKRATDGLDSELWIYGDLPQLPVEPAGSVTEERAIEQFGAPPVALVAGEIGVLGSFHGSDMRGYWSSEPLIVGAVRAVIRVLSPPSPFSPGP